MQTKTLIQSQANVVRITSLNKGDVVKLVQKEYSSTEVYYGVVLDLLNNGNSTFIQILLYKRSYGDFTAEIKTYSGEEDLALFPANVEEVREHFDSVIQCMERNLITEKKKLQDKVESLSKVKEFVSGESQKKLADASFTEITQHDFDKKKEALTQI